MITPGSNKEKGLEFELDAVFFEVIFGGEFNPVSPPSKSCRDKRGMEKFQCCALVTAKKLTEHVNM